MARALNKLTVRQVSALKAPGRHSDGGGLYLRITTAGARSWVFMTTVEGKRLEIGLGAAVAIPLARARVLAGAMREVAATGGDPRTITASEPADERPVTPTFGTFAENYIASVEKGWKNAVHRQQWRNSLRDHAASLEEVLITEMNTEHVLGVLKPIWLEKAETARRVRGRIEKILDAAKARGLRSTDAMNPAAWRGHLALLLPSQSKLERGHHAALPWKEAPDFMIKLRARTAPSARCLEFVILTAARSGEALGATWSEIDWKEMLWIVPAGRMKAGAQHVVPLSASALAVLEAQKPSSPKPDELIFSVPGTVRSNMAIAMLLRRMEYSHITTHGFRSSFRDWAGDASNFPREMIEQALAHTIQNKAERAYRRGTAVERRRVLMEEWATFLGSKNS